MPSWVVALEAVGSREVDVAAMAELTELMAMVGDVTTFADGRYVVHLVVPGAQPADALHAAMWVWRTTATDAGLPDWPVVRAEVVSPAGERAGKRRRHA
ncbi:MAG: hypothetical protein ABR520_02835 [Mycobacteriales bacterium]|nr:hypothetical protein [Frankia sp.]